MDAKQRVAVSGDKDIMMDYSNCTIGQTYLKLAKSRCLGLDSLHTWLGWESRELRLGPWCVTYLERDRWVDNIEGDAKDLGFQGIRTEMATDRVGCLTSKRKTV